MLGWVRLGVVLLPWLRGGCALPLPLGWVRLGIFLLTWLRGCFLGEVIVVDH